MARSKLKVEKKDASEKLTGWQWLLSEVKFFSTLIVVVVGFLTLVWGHFKIPSESMQPTLEVGDHLYVSKFAYGYSKHSLPSLLYKLPLPEGRILSKMPKRGDVVVFRNPKSGIVMIKRVVGLPGDTVQLRLGLLYLNNELDTDESITIYERNDDHLLDDTVAFIVPEDSLFFMGDNRDNSIDSRDPRHGPGIVHINYVMGRADRIMYSFKRCNRNEDLYCPPKGRFMKKL